MGVQIVNILAVGATLEEIGFSRKVERKEIKRFDPYTGNPIESDYRENTTEITIGTKTIVGDDISKFIYKYNNDGLSCLYSNYQYTGFNEDFPQETILGKELVTFDQYDPLTAIPDYDAEEIKSALKKNFGYEGEVKPYVVVRCY